MGPLQMRTAASHAPCSSDARRPAHAQPARLVADGLSNHLEGTVQYPLATLVVVLQPAVSPAPRPTELATAQAWAARRQAHMAAAPCRAMARPMRCVARVLHACARLRRVLIYIGLTHQHRPVPGHCSASKLVNAVHMSHVVAPQNNEPALTHQPCSLCSASPCSLPTHSPRTSRTCPHSSTYPATGAEPLRQGGAPSHSHHPAAMAQVLPGVTGPSGPAVSERLARATAAWAGGATLASMHRQRPGDTALAPHHTAGWAVACHRGTACHRRTGAQARQPRRTVAAAEATAAAVHTGAVVAPMAACPRSPRPAGDTVRAGATGEQRQVTAEGRQDMGAAPAGMGAL